MLNFPVFANSERENSPARPRQLDSDIPSQDSSKAEQTKERENENQSSPSHEDGAQKNQTVSKEISDSIGASKTPENLGQKNQASLKKDPDLVETSKEESPEVPGSLDQENQASPKEEPDLVETPKENSHEDKSLETPKSVSEQAGPDLDQEEVKKASLEENSLLKEGKVLEVDSLAKEPMAFGSPAKTPEKTIKVKSFEELKKAIADAGDEKTTIIITESFTLTETLTIDSGQDITLTADNKKVQDSWTHVKRPADYADQGEAKQREIIEEGRKRGEDALKKADLTKNPLPSQDKGDKIIKRAKDFIDDTLFKVFGKLTLGTEDSAVYIDGNKDEAKTELSNSGSVIDVNGELVMKNAVIMNSYNKHGHTGPIRVNRGGSFIMEGGRISSNTSYEQIDATSSRPYAAGAVYVSPGGTFTMKNGLIDNNVGGLTGGIFAGDLSGSTGNPAVVEIKGGIIAKNRSITEYQMGGGINGFPASKITITDGIIAGNSSEDVGGGIGISSQYIGSPSNILNDEKVTVNTNYQEWIKKIRRKQRSTAV